MSEDTDPIQSERVDGQDGAEEVSQFCSQICQRNYSLHALYSSNEQEHPQNLLKIQATLQAQRHTKLPRRAEPLQTLLSGLPHQQVCLQVLVMRLCVPDWSWTYHITHSCIFRRSQPRLKMARRSLQVVHKLTQCRITQNSRLSRSMTTLQAEAKTTHSAQTILRQGAHTLSNSIMYVTGLIHRKAN